MLKKWKTTGTDTELITLAEAKNYLKIDDFSEDDDLINSLISAAREWVEAYVNRKFVNVEITEKFDSFNEYLMLSVAPVVSVTSIKYYDTEGNEQTLNESVYSLDNFSEPCMINTKSGQNFPSVSSDTSNPIEVVYIAGFGNNVSDVPKIYRSAMLHQIRDGYDNRGNPKRNTSTDLVKRMLNLSRVKMY